MPVAFLKLLNDGVYEALAATGVDEEFTGPRILNGWRCGLIVGRRRSGPDKKNRYACRDQDERGEGECESRTAFAVKARRSLRLIYSHELSLLWD